MMTRSPRKTAAQWAQLVTEYTASTESERDFCARHDIKLATLRKWQYHYAAQESNSPRSTPAAFVKVTASASRSVQPSSVLRIGQDIRLECPASFDVVSLAQLALAVHHGR